MATNTLHIDFVVSMALKRALVAHAKKHKKTVADVLRESAAEAIGRPELAEPPKVGRPRTRG
jgi:hypothetical protein